MSLRSVFAKIATNPDFIAFNAHCFFAAFCVSTALLLGGSFLWVPIIATILAGIKEFYIDARYETPIQSFMDNLDDFIGYMAGICLGWGFIMVWRL